MSEQRTYVGKFWEIDTGGKTPEEYAKLCMERIGRTELPSYHDSWLEYLLDMEGVVGSSPITSTTNKTPHSGCSLLLF